MHLGNASATNEKRAGERENESGEGEEKREKTRILGLEKVPAVKAKRKKQKWLRGGHQGKRILTKTVWRASQQHRNRLAKIGGCQGIPGAKKGGDRGWGADATGEKTRKGGAIHLQKRERKTPSETRGAVRRWNYKKTAVAMPKRAPSQYRKSRGLMNGRVEKLRRYEVSSTMNQREEGRTCWSKNAYSG